MNVYKYAILSATVAGKLTKDSASQLNLFCKQNIDAIAI